MKKTSTIIFLSIILLNSFNQFSQGRISKPIPVIGSQIKGQLVKANGWLLNPESQWVSRPNKIPAYIQNQFKILIDYKNNGLGLDNFISYQLRDIKIEDSTYSILIKKYRDGYFEYPNIEEGWVNYNSAIFYVFNKSDLKNMSSTIVNDSINLVKVKVLYSNSLDWIKNETFISDIQKEIVKQITEKQYDDSENYLVFHIAPYKTKNIVQFQIYSVFGKYDIIGGIIKEHEFKTGDFTSDKEKIYLTNSLFKHCYFETDYLTFNNFIRLELKR